MYIWTFFFKLFRRLAFYPKPYLMEHMLFQIRKLLDKNEVNHPFTLTSPY